MSIDHYSILGILPHAEPIVISAAYRALAQRYHPDKWQGTPAVANKRMAELNEAYRVLSDPALRASYERERGASAERGEFASSAEQDEAFDAALAAIEQKWAIAVEVFPDLAELRASLNKTSRMLAFAFVTVMLETKQFDRRRDIAESLEDAFLRRYFGDSPQVLQYARSLIANGLKEAARTLNRYIDVVGSAADPGSLIERVEKQHGLEAWRETQYRQRATRETLARLIHLVQTNNEVEDARNLAHIFGYNTKLVGGGIFSDPEVHVTAPEGLTHCYANFTAFLQWVRSQIVPRAQGQI